MVKSIVIPHDTALPPRLQDMPDAGAFQEAVDGWLELVEVPGLAATMYVNEDAQPQGAPPNIRAMAIWWIYSVDPMQHPLLCGDVVLSGLPDENDGDVPESIVRDIFDGSEFTLEVRSYENRPRRETKARFSNIFDAATWCALLSRTSKRGVQFRILGSVLRST